ncbi:uncharacterized protein CLAFUR5_02586 [Fulvia fulva]|uniref:Protein CSF1 n=1 Tax=Passalora fulva TaxID=5499 RepID=A0A9Q8LAT0_PASFU|nr:uncharacterized protein CLAFUR5_02586 [Fulvia fulva]KAK4633241.1 hypothetical protein CLAFUR0_02594 [Fulvia fulva]UJO13931.1 hypothetical protein CLAFUR5_02586 [Fulvia fulva]
MTSLRAQPLNAEHEFNWVFDLEVLVIGILSLFFLFYFNRLFATVVSCAIRLYVFRYYKAWIDISALQISLLGGRIFFKKIRYHAHNVTVHVYEGHITWRYWLRAVKDAEVFQDEDAASIGRARSSSTSTGDEQSDVREKEKEKSRARSGSVGKEERATTKPKKELPCRISVRVAGVEAFIYNRSPVYDAVVEATMGKATQASKDATDSEASPRPETAESFESTQDGVEPTRTTTYNTTASTNAAGVEKANIPSFLRIFPIKVECKKAAAALGNESTKNIIVAKTEKGGGTFDAGHAGPLDIWQILMNFEVEDVVVQMKPNRDYKEQQLDQAQRVLREMELEEPQPSRPIRDTCSKILSLCSRLRGAIQRPRSARDSLRTASVRSKSVAGTTHAPLDQLPGQQQWHGLMRYLDDGEINEHEEWSPIEYAKASELVNVPKVTMRFFWDMPGPVPDTLSDGDHLQGPMYEDDINGAAPPAYGMDLGVYGGVVVYGPWADRQRLNLQPIFVPATYVDAIPAKSLKPGELRVCTVFQIKVIVEDDVVLRVPTREESKDAKWKGRADKANPDDPNQQDAVKDEGKHWKKHKHRKRSKAKQGTAAVDARPYGWLDVTVKKDSVVNFNMDMYPRATGYRNTLDLDVKGVEMSSSVNHGLLWRSGPVILDADISQPCSWNSLRKWPFNIVVNDLELFILRDHLFLIIDIVNDWASGAPSEFYTFVPYKYDLDITFNSFCMYLNVNDANIINDPADFDRNDFLTLEGKLHAVLGIPMEHYRPKRNQISFDVLASDMKMRMISPPKSTFHAFVEDKVMATLPKLTLNGSFNGNQEVQVGNVDVLRMDIVGTGLNLKAFGFFVRQLVMVKENYFGDYMHFKTLEEFQGASDDLQEANVKTASFPKPTSINELDVVLCIVAEDATVMLPTNLYSCKEFVRAELPRADLDLRIVSYYLDMGLQLSPVSLLTGTSPDDEDDAPLDTDSSTQFYCSHVELRGHRSFGLPPNEDAYVSQWDIDIGKITGEMSSRFVRDLALAGRALTFTIDDAENALPVVSPAVVLDASFVQVKTDIVRLWMHVGKDALLLDLEPVKVDVAGWASETFSQRVNVIVPLLTLACVDGRSASRHRSRRYRRGKDAVRTYAFLQTGVSLDVVGRSAHFVLETKKQQKHFKLHDQRTNRFPFLIRPNIESEVQPEDELDFEPPAIPYPFPPKPVIQMGGNNRPASIKSLRSFLSHSEFSIKSSSSSLSASIKSSRTIGSAKTRPSLLTRGTEATDISGTSASFHSFASDRPSSEDSGDGQGRRILRTDRERAKFGLLSSTMAFSSPYSEPYFPLELVRPDETNVPAFPEAAASDLNSDTSSVSEMITDPDIDLDAEHTTVMIKVLPGIRAYVEPSVAITASKLIKKVMPIMPEEVMDSFQMDVMGTIQAQTASKLAKSNIVEIQASLASAHLRIVALDESNEHIADQVDLTLTGLENSTRIRNQPQHDAAPLQFLSMHALLESLEVQLIDKMDPAPDSPPTVRLSVDDVLVWLSMANSNAFHLSFHDTNVAVTGSKAKYLTQLALKLIPIVKDIQTRFEDIFASNARRLQTMSYVMTYNGDTVGDPPFMGRLLYVLRVVPTHLRNTDSWKILARFRYILMHLPQDAKNQLEANVKDAKLNIPADTPRDVLESWTQSRNWDVPYVNQTVAFQKLRGDEITQLKTTEQKETSVTFRSESLRVAIEHAKGNSDIILEETSLELENSPPSRPEGLMLVDENKRTKTTVQMHTNTIALALDWGLFYVAEDVISLADQIEEVKAHLESHGHTPTSQKLEEGLLRHDIHAVVSMGTGSIAVRSASLRHVSRADGLKMSFLGTTQASEELGQCESVIVNVDRAVTELHGAESRIWQTLITSPSIYVDHLTPAVGIDTPATVTLAISYDDLQIAITEQVPGILHIVDTIITEEVAKCQRLAEIVQANKRTRKPSIVPNNGTAISRPSTASGQAPKLHVAVLAGNLEMEISLLSTLSYQLKGTAASIRVAPSLAKDQVFSIDFDAGRQEHSFLNTSGDDTHTQGLLDVPPINGHVGLELGQEETAISVVTTIEKVQVDAGAIQGLVGVIIRPEVQDIVSAVKVGVDGIKGHIAEIFPEGETAQRLADPKKRQIVFDTRFALLGIRVSASTPRVVGNSTAEVEFGIGPLHATASNKAMPKEIIPEVRMHIQDIGASLKIKERGKLRPCGNATLTVSLHFKNLAGEQGATTRSLKVSSHGPEVNAYPETASTIIDVINHLQDRIKHLDLSKEVEYLRRMRDERRQTVVQKISGNDEWTEDQELPFSPEDLLAIKTTIELTDIKACWLVDPSFAANKRARVDDLVLSIQSIEFTTRSGNEARLTIKDMMLQLAKKDGKQTRSLNSGLLSEMGFSVGYWKVDNKRHAAIRATGKPLDLRLESRFILPVNALQKSIEMAIDDARKGTATWESTPTSSGAPRSSTTMFDNKHLGSLLVEADFAGAQVYMQGSMPKDRDLSTVAAASQLKYGARHGRYGQFAGDGELLHTTLTAPGIAFKLEYNSLKQQPTINAELMIDASSNMLLPNVVPLVQEVSNSVKELVRDKKPANAPIKQVHVSEVDKPAQKFFDTGDDSIIDVTPAKIFGKTKFDLGFRIAKQEFGLSCQPIARVDAKASLEDFYVTMNTIDSDEHGHFFATSAVLTGLKAQVKHVYSREPTFSYDMESIVLSAMNNKHLSGQSGISAILNVNPTRIVINGKQFQDLLLFREIWLPPEIRNAAAEGGPSSAKPAASRADEFLVQKYQTVAAAAAFPWNATVSIARLSVDVDLGQSIGKSSFTMTNLWASQAKTSNWEQNLCIGLDEMAVNSTGRMSGFIQLAKLGIRTSIRWPEENSEATMQKTPLIQASIGFDKLLAKAAFDYQAFAFGDIEGFDFLMYNVRDAHGKSDRLVAVLDCEKAYVFCTSTSAAQAVGLYQAFDRLIQEKQSAYVQSLRDIEKHVRRESTIVPTRFGPMIPDSPVLEKKSKDSPIRLHTDVVVTVGAICFGVYPSTFFDSQMLKLEANNIQARFAAGLERGRVTSGLGMTLGQLQVGLSSVRRITAVPKALEVTVDEVINSALNAKGGTILRVPKVIASMQSWQTPQSNEVDYIFKSLFDGKIDVGWNLSRIDFIKNMWLSGSKALASRLDRKSLPESAVKIRAGPDPDQPASPPKATSSSSSEEDTGASNQQEKITAEINLPQSRYEYHALEPPIIETPQLRDMGEATPPLEWIGLHRDRLPNVTHQILIVSLLEVCKEVEDAYGKILGSR